MYKQPQDPVDSAEALKFFDWAYTNGTKAAEELDYVPLPAPVVAQIEKTWADGNQGLRRQACVRQVTSQTTGLSGDSSDLPFRSRRDAPAAWPGSAGVSKHD